MGESERRARAEERRARATLYRAQLQPRERDLDPVRGPDAISLVTVLTREAWSLSGKAWPSYARGEIPVVFVGR